MLDEFEDGYGQWLADHPYFRDVENAVPQIMGPRDYWGGEYHAVAEDVSCALVMCIRKGRLDESGVEQIQKDGMSADCSWLLSSVVSVGELLAEKWKKYRDK